MTADWLARDHQGHRQANLVEDEMSRYTTVMLGGIAMTSTTGALMIWWLSLNTGSGFVGLLFIAGMLVGMAVFAVAAAEATRAPNYVAGSSQPHQHRPEETGAPEWNPPR